MARQLVKMPSFSQVAAGNTITLNLPLGLTYDALAFVTGSLALSELTDVKVILNSRTVQEYDSLEQLKQFNDYYSRPGHAGGVKLWFVRPEMADIAQRRHTALGTVDLQTATIQMKVAKTPADASDVSVECWAMQSNSAPVGQITKVKHFPRTFSVSGEQDIDSIPRTARIAAIHMFKADVSNVRFRANNAEYVDATKSMLENFQKDYGRAPLSAKATHLDFILEGDHAQAFVADSSITKDLRLKPTIESAGSVGLIVEYIDSVNGI